MRTNEPMPLNLEQTLQDKTVDTLKTLIPLTGQRLPVPPNKGKLVGLLRDHLTDPTKLRALYESLDELGRQVVQEATHHPEGKWEKSRLNWKYGRTPESYKREGYYQLRPLPLALFFLNDRNLPTDVQQALRKFVPEPAPLEMRIVEPLPETFTTKEQFDEIEYEIRVRTTTRAALQDVRSVLRLVESGSVKVGEKTGRASAASLKAISAVLVDGDYYSPDDRENQANDPAADLLILPFAWPLLLQAGGLAKHEGTKLTLSANGLKAMTQPAPEVLKSLWKKWQKTDLLDEFSRVNIIKGQQSRGALTAVAPRRQEIEAALQAVPTGQWFRIEDFFRWMAVQQNLEVGNWEEKLYIGSISYGNLSEGGNWEMVEGRYILAYLFEYVATLGLIDLAYVPPQYVCDDFTDHWGAEDISCLSRYDGLLYLRINAFGAWVLGRATTYTPEVEAVPRLLRVLPNLDVVTTGKPLPVSEVLFLERFADKRSESVWHLERATILNAVEKGQSLAELREFLTARSIEELPGTAVTFLDDLEKRTSLLRDLGTARMIECMDVHTALLLVNDRRLRNVCQLAGERTLVFSARDEAAVRKALRELGYVLPPG